MSKLIVKQYSKMAQLEKDIAENRATLAMMANNLIIPDYYDMNAIAVFWRVSKPYLVTNPYLLPKFGLPDANPKRRVWRRETFLKWVAGIDNHYNEWQQMTKKERDVYLKWQDHPVVLKAKIATNTGAQHRLKKGA